MRNLEILIRKMKRNKKVCLTKSKEESEGQKVTCVCFRACKIIFAT